MNLNENDWLDLPNNSVEDGYKRYFFTPDLKFITITETYIRPKSTGMVMVRCSKNPANTDDIIRFYSSTVGVENIVWEKFIPSNTIKNILLTKITLLKD